MGLVGLRRALLALAVTLGTALLVASRRRPRPRPTPTSRRAARPTGRASRPPRRTIELRFTEHVVLASTEIVVTEPDGHRVAPTAMTLVESDEDQEAPATVVATIPRARRRRLPRVLADPVERRPPRVRGHLRLRRAERGAGGRSERDEPGPLRARRPVGRPRGDRGRARRRRRRAPAAPRAGGDERYAAGLAAPSGVPSPRRRGDRRPGRRARRSRPLRRRGLHPRLRAAVGAARGGPARSGARPPTRPAGTGEGVARPRSHDRARRRGSAHREHRSLRGPRRPDVGRHLDGAPRRRPPVGGLGGRPRAARRARRAAGTLPCGRPRGPAGLPHSRDGLCRRRRRHRRLPRERRRRLGRCRAAHHLRSRPAGQGRPGRSRRSRRPRDHPCPAPSGVAGRSGPPAARRSGGRSACSSSPPSVVSSPRGSPPSLPVSSARRHRASSTTDRSPTSSRPSPCGRTVPAPAWPSSTCSTPVARPPGRSRVSPSRSAAVRPVVSRLVPPRPRPR